MRVLVALFVGDKVHLAHNVGLDGVVVLQALVKVSVTGAVESRGRETIIQWIP